MPIKRIKTENIMPRLLRITCFDRSYLKRGDATPERIAYDYEIEYHITDGNGTYIDHVFYPTPKGTINFRKPGQILKGIYPNHCFLVVMDLEGNSKNEGDFYYFNTNHTVKPVCDNEILNALPNIFTTTDTAWYDTTFKELLKADISETEASKLKINALLLSLIYKIYEDSTHINKELVLSNAHIAITLSREYIATHYKKNIGAKDIAKYAGVSPNYLHAVFKTATGLTLCKYLLKIRLKYAAEFLATTNIPIYEVAEKTGFRSSTYFSYTFKKEVGISALSYRKQFSSI